MIQQTEINQVHKFSDSLYMITEAESTQCYLILGTEKALLFDTGYGYENILPIIRSITNLPIMIVISHGDPDHGLGSGHYPEVYIHPLDLGKLLNSDNDDIKKKSVTYRLKKLPRIKAYLNIEKFMKLTLKDTTFKFLFDGDKICLGGKTLEVIHTPGHSYGHICLLDVSEGSLFTGDVLTRHNIWYFLSNDEQAPFEQALSAYKHLQTRISEIKNLYPAHNVTPLNNKIIDQMVECLSEELPENYQNDILFNSFMGQGYQHFYKNVNLIYSDQRLGTFLKKKIKR